MTATRKYNKDGSYTKTLVYEEPDKNGTLSFIGNYNKDDRYLGGKYYTDKNFSQLRLIETKKYNKDGSYTKTCVFDKPNKDGALSVTENYNKDDIYLGGKYYIDKNFSQLILSRAVKYNENGEYTVTMICEETNDYGCLSYICNYDKDGRHLGTKYFNEKNFSNLSYTQTIKYNEDGSYSETWVREQPDEYYLSYISNYDKDCKYIGGKYYTDKNFSQLSVTETRKYNEDGSYTGTWVSEQPNETEDLSFVIDFDKDDKILCKKYFTNKNFSQLRLTETKKYNKDGSYTKTFVYEQPDPNGNLSLITYNDKDEQCIHAISFKDKSFSVINRISLWKHINKWSYCLRIYPNQDKTSCNADIEKYEKNSSNLIYKKPCNFKGNLERVNRLLS